MRTVRGNPWLPISASVLFLGSLAASGEASKRVPVTDPAVLASMGFSPDARNVYQLLGPPAKPLEVERGPGAKYFGGTSSGFSGKLGQSFQGRFSSFAYGNLTGLGDIYNTNPGTDNFADVEVDVPSGAEIEFVRAWVNDTNAVHNITVFFLEVCQPMFDEGDYVLTTLATMTSNGSGGDQSLVSSTSLDSANSNSCVYKFRVRFGNNANIGPGDSSLVIQKVRAQWRRTVSPAPLVATFPVDVPTTHPFFRFVEALASSGITAGTGPGTFGPDDPVTRGQMAVFLAVALGLDHGF
ncbi:MAG TPA: S-layer homology domain-containing protein [Thermoanaerobaculia bacterium]